MKHQKLSIYKNTLKGDVIASDREARKAIQKGRLIKIGSGKKSYWVIQSIFLSNNP